MSALMPVKVSVKIAEHKGKRLLRRGSTVVTHDPNLATWIADQVLDADVDVSCEIRPGVGLVAVEAGGQSKTIPPAALVEGYLERGRVVDALEELSALDDAKVEADATLLLFRLRARSATGAATLAEEDFARLAALESTTPIELKDAFDWLREAFKRRPPPALKEKFAAWAGQHLVACASWGVAHVLEHVPIAHWPLGVLLGACDEEFDSPSELSEPERVRRWLERAAAIAPNDPRVKALPARWARYEAKVRKARDRAAKARLASRPNFDRVERMFAVRLPAELRAAWERWYEVPCDLRFIHVDRTRLKQLTNTAEFIFDEHGPENDGELQPVPGKPYPIFPFAEGGEDSDYFVLDLSRPTGDDFPVLLAVHDSAEDPHEVAASSHEWLANGVKNWPRDS